jgi:hypothetical protein
MSKTKQVLIQDLHLDLKNFRTVTQTNEIEAIKAMIAISPDRFWALMDSLLDDGYLPTENIIGIMDATGKHIIVREGNRRVAVLKIIYDLVDVAQLNLPTAIQTKINNISSYWKAGNRKIPCTIFEASEYQLVDRIVTMAHGKGEKASRDPWTSIAKARHNRDINRASEPGLDLLEKYLKLGRNLNGQQKERFAGDYPISILDSIMQKLSVRFGATNPADLAAKYPTLTHVNALEDILLNTGLRLISFEMIRSTTVDFAVKFGLPPIPAPVPATPIVTPASPVITPTLTPPAGIANPTTSSPGPTNTSTPVTASPTTPAATPTSVPSTPAAALNTPKSVINKMKMFIPMGQGREKVVTLRDEMVKLNIKNTPIAFCFVLRSLFEISVKAYFTDNNLSLRKSDGNQKSLLDMLKEAKTHITARNSGMVRSLHGAITELGRPAGLLSVTSMNQLVHNPAFSIREGDICSLFGNIYPLLEALN